MTPAKHFRRRLLAQIRFQYQTIRTVADWTVQVYMGIPALLALVIWQVNMWHAQQVWLDTVSLPLFLAFLCFLFSMGDLRLYIQEADVLFLRQQKRWFDGIVHRGMIFSFLRDCFVVGFWFLIAAPFFIQHYHFSWSAVIGVVFLGLMIKENMQYSKHLLSQRYGRFVQSVTYFLFVIGFVVVGTGFYAQPYGLVALDLVFMGLFLYFIKLRLQLQGSFLNDVALEQQAKWRLATLLFSQVMPPKKKPFSTRKRPHLFPYSGGVFRKQTPVFQLADAYIKLFLRQSQSRSGIYVILLFAVIAFLFVTPMWLKWGGWMAILFLIADWLCGHIKECGAHPFLQLWYWAPETKQKAGEVTIRYLLFPVAIISGGVLGGITFSWLGVGVMVFLGFIIVFPLAKLFTFGY